MATLTLTPPDHFTREHLETRDRWTAWLEANALDPHEVAVRSGSERLPFVVDEDAATVTVTCFVVVDGQKRLSDDRRSFKKEQRTVPLFAHPRGFELTAALCAGGVHVGGVDGNHDGCSFRGAAPQA